MKTTVLVTDGEQRSALAVVRSLGRAGYRAVVISRDGRSLAGASRYAAADLPAPPALTEPERFAQAVAEIARAQEARVILPLTDAAVLALLPARAQLAPAVIPFPDLATFRQASDKAWAADAAAGVGIASPARVLVRTPRDAVSLPRHSPLTRVLKPTRSVVDGNKLGVSYVPPEQDVVAALEALPQAAFPVLVQEHIEGPGVGVFLLRWDGRTRAAFAHRRLREKPPSGGVSVLRESIALDAEVRTRAEALLELLDWCGVAMVELKLSVRDGRLYLMEINGRFWGSLQLAIDAGVDFPRLLVELALGRDPGPVPAHRAGVLSRWTLGDLDHLLTCLRRGPNGGHGIPGRAAALLGFGRGFLAPVRSEVFRWSDPHPAAREARLWLRDLKPSSTSR